MMLRNDQVAPLQNGELQRLIPTVANPNTISFFCKLFTKGPITAAAEQSHQ